MTVYAFELRFSAPAGHEVIGALYEAGWDDAVVSLDPGTGGEGAAIFDRESASAVKAVASALVQGRKAGVQITGVTEDLVTLKEIAERTGRSFAAADHWAAGRRGPGGFPAPRVPRARVSLYSWAEVAMWLRENGLAHVSPADVEIARICEIADSMIRAHRLQAGLPDRDRLDLCRAVA